MPPVSFFLQVVLLHLYQAALFLSFAAPAAAAPDKQQPKALPGRMPSLAAEARSVLLAGGCPPALADRRARCAKPACSHRSRHVPPELHFPLS
jgi:hypothetical protein